MQTCCSKVTHKWYFLPMAHMLKCTNGQIASLSSYGVPLFKRPVSHQDSVEWIFRDGTETSNLECMTRAYTPIQRHVNNAWSEMASCSPLLCVFFFFFFFCSYKQYGITLIPFQTSIVAFFYPYSFSCLFHYISIGYEQSNALPSIEKSLISQPMSREVFGHNRPKS